MVQGTPKINPDCKSCGGTGKREVTTITWAYRWTRHNAAKNGIEVTSLKTCYDCEPELQIYFGDK